MGTETYFGGCFAYQSYPTAKNVRVLGNFNNYIFSQIEFYQGVSSYIVRPKSSKLPIHEELNLLYPKNRNFSFLRTFRSTDGLHQNDAGVYPMREHDF